MSYFALLWKARTIETCRLQYEKEKYKSIEKNNMEVPANNVWDRWRRCRINTKKKILESLRTKCSKESTACNFFVYLRTDQTFPNFLLKSVIGFFGGILMTYLCFMFFIFQLSISLIHATIMSSVIGVLLTLGLAFSYRVRCLVFLLIPQFFSRVGRYTLTCYALVLILTGPATNTLKNSEVLSESMACSQEQIKTSVNQIRDAMKKPFHLLIDSIKLMIDKLKEVEMEINKSFHNIERLVLSIAAVLQLSSDWLDSIVANCNKKVGTPYELCIKNMNEGVLKCKAKFGANNSYCNSDIAQSVCTSLKNKKAICQLVDFMGSSVVATIKKRLKIFFKRIKSMIHVNVHVQKSYTFSTNTSHSASQVAAGIVTEIRNRADPLLTWLSWSSCVTSLFLLLIIFRAKYYQNMYETRSGFDNRYITNELRQLDLKRLRLGRETILPLNRRERTKYINTLSFRLIATERINLSRSVVFMIITTFKLLIHMVADYSLYWVLMTMRYYGRLQTPLQSGPPNAGIFVPGKGPVAKILRSLIESLTVPLKNLTPSSIPCLPNPYRPDLGRYSQIGVLIILLWIFALFEPYGLRLRHVIMGHYRPERATARATWLYNHILRTRGGFMKYARRKLHRQYKCSSGENFTFWYWIQSHLPCSWIRSLFGFGPVNPKCLLCGTRSSQNDSDIELIRCETSKCPGTYCGKCFSDIGELCTICLSPGDYGDLSDLSLEKGSSSESYDSDEDIKDFNKLSKAPQSGTSNQHVCQTYFYKHVYYKELNQTSFGKLNTNNTSKSNALSQYQQEDVKLEKAAYEWTEDEYLNSITLPSNLEHHTIYLRKATLVRRKKRCYKQETRNQFDQNKLGNKIAKYNNSNHFYSESETTPKIKDNIKTNRKGKTNKTISSNMFKQNKNSEHHNFCCCRRRWIFSPARKSVCCHKRKTINLTCKLRKRNVNKSIKNFKTKLHSHQQRFNKFMKSQKKCTKKKIKAINRVKYSSPVNFCSSDFCPPHHLYDINKEKCCTVRKSHRPNKLTKILRNYKHQYKTNLSTVQDFIHCQEHKCRIPYCLQSKKFLRSYSLRYTVSDENRLNFLHNFTMCSFDNKQTGKKTANKNNKQPNTINLNECCCEDIIKNKYKVESSKNCINKNLFTRCYFYWQNIKNKSRTALIAESKRKSKKLRNDNKNYKRRKKHKLEYLDVDTNKFNKEDDENARNFRLTSYLESQEWYIPHNENKEKEGKLEKKTKGKNKAKHKKKKIEAKDQNNTSKIPDKTAEIILNVKSLNTGAVKNKPNNHASTEVKKIKSDKTISSSEKVLLIENYEYGIEAKVKEILKLEPDEICQENRFSNLRIAITDDNADEVIISNKSGTSKKLNDKEKEEVSLSSSVKESRNIFTIMKTLCTSVLSLKNNKETQKDLDKKIQKTSTFDKDLQTEETEQCKADICVQTDNIQITDKELNIQPTVSHSTCQYLADDDWQRSITTQTTLENFNKPSTNCDAQVGTSIHKCTCATQYTTFKKDIGTNHRNSLLKVVNIGIQCTRSPILTKHAAHNLFHNKIDLNIIKEVSEKIMGMESSEDNMTSSITSEDSDKSEGEGAKTDTTVCSYVTMEYLDESTKVKNRRYKIVLVTKANRSTETDKTEICNASTVTDDWWSPMLGRKDYNNTEIKKTITPLSRRLKMKEAGATTEGRIVKFRSKTKIIPAGTKEILSPSRYLLESQKYYNELYTDLYQSAQKQKGDQVLLKSRRKYHKINNDRKEDICNKDNANETELNLQKYLKNNQFSSQSFFHPYKLVQCQCNKLDSCRMSNVSGKAKTKSISCQKTTYKESQNSGLKRAEPNIYLPQKLPANDPEIDPNCCVWDSSNNL